MKKTFSKNWKSSKQPRKQHKYLARAPLHIKHKFLGTHLSKELKKRYKIRALPVRKEDQVIIKRGQFKGLSGKVERVNLKKTRIYVNGAQLTKLDGSKSYYPIHPSNVIITELNMKDKERAKILERKSR